jgi:hypothetical protein
MQALKHPIENSQELRLTIPQCRTSYPTQQPCDRVPLNFSTLRVFELVQEHFQSLGVWFEHAIAIPPSNPAFQTDSAQLVLMPIAGHTTITAYFQHPPQWVQADLTGARQIRLTAHRGDAAVLTQYTPQTQVHLGQITPIAFPSHRLELESDRITKVTLDSPAPFLLSGFCYQV